MFIDTHCHLNFPQFNEDRPAVMGNAKKAGVKKFINPGVDRLSSQQAVALANEHPGVVFAAAGFHPYEAQHNPVISQLPLNGIIAIGEIGLDYHQYKGEEAAGKKQNQKLLFEEQLAIAAKHNLPVIMHCRDAFEDFFTIFDSYAPRGVIHCFSGGLQEVRMAEERGLLLGVDGNSTYSTHLQSIIPHIPISMILLETDAPFLTPVPHRGTRNEPKYIPHIAKMIAGLQNVDTAAVERQTTKNATELFRI